MYFYEHIDGSIISKPDRVVEMGGGPNEYFTGPFVKRWWWEQGAEAMNEKQRIEESRSEFRRLSDRKGLVARLTDANGVPRTPPPNRAPTGDETMPYKHQTQSYRIVRGKRLECFCDVEDLSKGPLKSQALAIAQTLRRNGRDAKIEKMDGFYRVFAEPTA